MKRLVFAGLLLGVANGLAAAVALYLVYRSEPDAAAFGWFAYAPLNENVVHDYSAYYDFPWHYVVVPAVLIALNALLLPLAVRRGWLRG